MAEFNKFTSGFNVGEENIGIIPAKIQTGVNDERVVSTITSETTPESLPNVSAVTDYVTAAVSALSDEVLEQIEEVSGKVTEVSGKVETLESYFDEDGAALAAVSAAQADKFKTAQEIEFIGDAVGSVSFDGSAAVSAELTIDKAGALSADAESVKVGFAMANEVEKALAVLESEIGQIAAFDGPYATIEEIPTPYATDKIFLVGPIGELDDKFQEYISTDGENLKLIGDTTMDLSSYAKIDWVNDTYSATKEVVEAASANWDEAYDAVSGMVTDSADLTAAENAGKLASVGALTAYDAKNVTSAFGTVIVGDQAYVASAKNDTIKFVAGDNMELVAATDEQGNPSIIINNTYSAEAEPEISGFNGVTAEFDAENRIYNVSGVDATTAVAGITKAAYYNEETGLIHLF